MPREVVPDSKHVVMVAGSNGLRKTTYAIVNFNPGWSKEDHPIVNVPWADAMANAHWPEVDLPTEAQREKAARGTDARKYPWGNDFDSSKLWCSRKVSYDAGGTHRVGELGVSPYGITDMAGNVEQWCKDGRDFEFLKGDHGPDPLNPGDGTSRVLRGSSWDIPPSGKINFRTAQRSVFGDPTLADSDYDGTIGFRCAVQVAGAQPSGSAGAKSGPSTLANQKAAATPPQTPSEQYHAVDPAKAGFKIVLKVNDMTQNSEGQIEVASLKSALIDDAPSPTVKGREYPMELISQDVTNGTIRTKQFGNFKISSQGGFGISVMMTDSQVAGIQAFLKSKRN